MRVIVIVLSTCVSSYTYLMGKKNTLIYVYTIYTYYRVYILNIKNK